MQKIYILETSIILGWSENPHEDFIKHIVIKLPVTSKQGCSPRDAARKALRDAAKSALREHYEFDDYRRFNGTPNKWKVRDGLIGEMAKDIQRLYLSRDTILRASRSGVPCQDSSTLYFGKWFYTLLDSNWIPFDGKVGKFVVGGLTRQRKTRYSFTTH